MALSLNKPPLTNHILLSDHKGVITRVVLLKNVSCEKLLWPLTEIFVIVICSTSLFPYLLVTILHSPLLQLDLTRYLFYVGSLHKLKWAFLFLSFCGTPYHSAPCQFQFCFCIVFSLQIMLHVLGPKRT